MLVLAGAWFLLDEFVPFFNADLFWPLALVGFGMLIVVAAVRPRPDAYTPTFSPTATATAPAGANHATQASPEPGKPASTAADKP
jgi:hypothetical protein